MDMNDALDALSALSQPSRLQIFRLLVRRGHEGMPAGAIAESLGGRQNTISTHLAVLARSGLVRSEREGRSVVYRADLAAAGALVAFLLEDCCDGRPEACTPVLQSLSCLQPQPQRERR